MTEQPTPRTEAGVREAVQLAIARGFYRDEKLGEITDRVMAVVAQARTEALDDAVERVEAAWTAHGAVSRRVIIAAILAAKETPDTASEYGRLLADRDRLIGEGVDPDDLLVPEPPARETP